MRADSQPGPKARPNRHRDSGQSRPEPAVWLPTVPRMQAPGRAHARRRRDPRVLARFCPDFVAILACLEPNP